MLLKLCVSFVTCNMEIKSTSQDFFVRINWENVCKTQYDAWSIIVLSQEKVKILSDMEAARTMSDKQPLLDQ